TNGGSGGGSAGARARGLGTGERKAAGRPRKHRATTGRPRGCSRERTARARTRAQQRRRPGSRPRRRRLIRRRAIFVRVQEMRISRSLLVVLFICASCAKGTSTDQVLPPGATITPLPQPAYVGIGRYSKLAETTVPQSLGGIPFISFIEVRQSAGSTYPQRDV